MPERLVRSPGHRAAQQRGARSRACGSGGQAGPCPQDGRRRHLHGRGPGRRHGQGAVRPGRRRQQGPGVEHEAAHGRGGAAGDRSRGALHHQGGRIPRARRRRRRRALPAPGRGPWCWWAAGTSCSARANPPRTRCSAMPGLPRLPSRPRSRCAKTASPDQVEVLVDDSLFTGPSLNPAWSPEDVAAGEMAPLFPLALNRHGSIPP